MGADYPDWGGIYINRAFYPSFDMAELAVRLGSSVFYDRRGNVIFTDDFEQGLGKFTWDFTLLDGGYSLDVAYVEHGGFSAHINAPAATGAENWVYRRLTIPQCKYVGFLATYLITSPYAMIVHEVQLDTGSEVYTFAIRVNSDDKTLSYYDADGNWQEFQSLNIQYVIENIFALCKLVIDIESYTYERFIVANDEYDLSGISPRRTTPASTKSLLIKSGCRPVIDEAQNLYIDSVIVTANEPANS